jgi:hypothetical protein
MVPAAIRLLERFEIMIYENILDGHLSLEALKRNNDRDRLRRENTFFPAQERWMRLYPRKLLATSFSPSFTTQFIFFVYLVISVRFKKSH